jgi:hypothetical protein
VEGWWNKVEEYCKLEGVPLMVCSGDNAQPHRDYFEHLLDGAGSEKVYEFPWKEFDFWLGYGRFDWPKLGLQDPRHWLRCMVAAVTNPRNLVMIGDFPVLYSVLVDIYSSHKIPSFKKRYLKQNAQQVLLVVSVTLAGSGEGRVSCQ